MLRRLCTVLRFMTLVMLLSACASDPTSSLGVQDGKLAPCPATPNCVSSQTDNEEQRIRPFHFNAPPEVAFNRLAQVLAARADATLVEQTDRDLRAELHTTLFVDDGEFLLNPAEQVIEVRSSSRLGYYDFGENRRRLEEIRRAFARQEDTP